MAQHFGQSRILTQPIEVLQTISSQRVQHQKSLDVGGLVKTALPLLQRQVPAHALRHSKRAGERFGRLGRLNTYSIEFRTHQVKPALLARPLLLRPKARLRNLLRTDYGLSLLETKPEDPIPRNSGMIAFHRHPAANSRGTNEHSSLQRQRDPYRDA
jgi:hypothetical protein